MTIDQIVDVYAATAELLSATILLVIALLERR